MDFSEWIQDKEFNFIPKNLKMKKLNWLSLTGYLVLCFGALLGNKFSLPLFFGVDFIFGSVFVFIIIGLFGFIAALPAALVASSYTYLLWNHPYAIIIFMLEYLIVGLLYHRYQKNMVLMDTAFWLVLGIPLVYLFYSVAMDLPVQSVVLIMLKQSVNGIFNVFIAFIIITFIPIVLRSTNKEQSFVSFRNVVFTSILLSLSVPALAIVLFLARYEFNKIEENIIQELNTASLEVEGSIDDWFSHKLYTVNQTAQQLINQTIVPSPDTQKLLEQTLDLTPDFHNMYIANKSGITTSFFPPVNIKGKSTIGLDFSDRDYFKLLKGGQKMVISDVFRGRGGVFSPIITLSSQILREGEFNGFALAALKIGHIKDIIDRIAVNRSRNVTIIDSRQQVIASTVTNRQVLNEYNYKNVWDVTKVEDGIFHGIRKEDAVLSEIKKWNNSIFIKPFRAPFNDKWTIILEVSTKPYILELNQFYIFIMLLIFCLSVASVMLSIFISSLFVKSILQVQQASSHLPKRIEEGEEIEWPRSFIREINGLIENFRVAGKRLGVTFDKLTENRKLLAKRVEERTEELSIANKELSTSHERIKTIINTAEDGIISIDHTGNIQLFNTAAERIFQYSAHEVVGKNVNQLMPQPYHDLHDGYLKRFLESREAKIIGTGREVHGRKKDGTVFPMRLAIGEMMQDENSIFVGVLDDITQQKETEKDLIESREKAEEASRLKSEFLNTMSHELRTPMTVILGNIDELTDENALPGSEEIVDIANDITNAGNHLLHIINDLLDISKIEAGKMELVLETVKSRDLIQDAVNTVKKMAEIKNIDLSLQDEPTELTIDPFRIKQVILNLLSNAIKFTDQGYVKVVTEISEKNFIIKVQDSGCGIVQKDLAFIFDPFRQVDGSVRRSKGGTGLGLAISQKLVFLHGGSISVTSEPEVGSEFVISLPM